MLHFILTVNEQDNPQVQQTLVKCWGNKTALHVLVLSSSSHWHLHQQTANTIKATQENYQKTTAGNESAFNSSGQTPPLVKE
jgi:hypothetical protein